MSEKISCDVHLRIYLNKKDLVYRFENNFNLLIQSLLHKVSKPTFEVLKVMPNEITREKLAEIRDKLIAKEKIEMEKPKRNVIIDLGSVTSEVPKDLDEDLINDYCFNHLDDEEIEIDKVIVEEEEEENMSFVKKKGDRFDREKSRKTRY